MKRPLKKKTVKSDIFIALVLFSSLLFSFSLIPALVAAQDWIVDNPMPEINLTFDEIPISSVNATLRDSFLETYELTYHRDEVIINGINITRFLYTPTTYLLNGLYNFHISGYDVDGNLANESTDILVDVPYNISIRLVSPELGISNHTPFDFAIATRRNATCRYGMRIIEFDNLEDWYNSLTQNYDQVLLTDPEDEEYTHTRFNFSVGSDGSYYVFVVICNNSNGYAGKNFMLGYDTSAPSITVSSDPNPIIDPNAQHTTFNIHTDDPSLCRIRELDGYGLEYNVLPYNPDDPTYFRTTHSHTMTYSYQSRDFANPIFRHYNITCTNLAGFASSVQYVQLLNFTLPLTITMTSPQYTSKNYYEFTVQTNMEADCILPSPYGEMPGDGITHMYNFTQLGEQRYGVNVTCMNDYREASENFWFQIDRQTPAAPNITVDDSYCSLSSATATFASTDGNGSGIDYFNYSIKRGSDYVRNWARSPSGNPVNVRANVELEENVTYQWNVVAVDHGGLASTPSTASFSVLNPDSDECDDSPPVIRVSKIRYNGVTEFNVTCTDDQSGCEDEYYFGVARSRGNCHPEDRRDFGVPDTVNETSYICWNASDRSGNSVSDDELITVSSNDDNTSGGCSDNIHNGDESDVDCGGPQCERCGAGKLCFSNEDCISNYCNAANVCDEASCTDGMKNGDETSTDCGGSCGACNLGGACTSDEQCVSGLICYNLVCSPDREADTDGDGLPDWWEYEKFGCIECADPDDDYDNDGFSNMEEFNAMTDPKDENDHPEKGSIFPLILLILGLALMFGGAGYLVYAKYVKQEPSNTPNITVQNTLGRNPNVARTEEKTKVDLVDKVTEKRLAQRMLQKRKERRSLLGRFESNSDEDVKVIALEDKPTINKQTVKQVKQKFTEAEENPVEKLDTKDIPMDEEGYIDITKLGAKKDTKSDKSSKEDLGKDVFQRLGSIKQLPKTSKRITMKPLPKSVVGADKGTGKKVLDSMSENVDKTTKLSNKQIFDKLAEMSGKSSASIQEIASKKKITKKDMMDIFANVTERKQINTDVFKFILAQLLQTNQISKQTVSNILFGLMDKKLLTKGEVSKIMNELNMVPK